MKVKLPGVSTAALRLASLLAVMSALSGISPRAADTPSSLALSNLRAGAVKVDITPPIGIKLAGYQERTGPSTGIHDPLHASVVFLEDGIDQAAIIAMDTISLSTKDGADLRKAIEAASGVRTDHILLNASHSHGSPRLAIDEAYRSQVIAKVAGAASAAKRQARRVSLGYGEGTIDFNINRRVINVEGKAVTGRLNPAGIVDRRLKVIRLDDGGALEPMALLVQAVCHANVFRGANTEITADFVGNGMTRLEQALGRAAVGVYLQGCTGDVRANLPGPTDFRDGDEADMAWCSSSLASEAARVAARSRVREELIKRPAEVRLAAGMATLRLEPDPAKLGGRRTRDRIEDGRILFPVQVMRLGPIWLVSLPGEPVVEYGLRIEKELSRLGKIVVLGYGAGDVGYIPVKHMIAEGGYEAEGPYTERSEQEIVDGVKRLADSLAAK